MRQFTSFRNRVRQWRHPDEKIFFIGFNKCGTTAFHQFALQQGLRSFHWKMDGRFLALEIEMRLKSSAKLQKFLSHWTVYSDMTFASETKMVDANRYFAVYADLYPNAFFILNDRNEDRWISSRMRHGEGRYLEQAKSYYSCNQAGVESIWRQRYSMHIAAVLEHFTGSHRFLHYFIDRDPIERIIDFVSPSFTLDPASWKSVNRTKK